MSETATMLTREQLQRALEGFDDHGTMADYRHLHQLAEGARLLLAMKPASDEEMRQAIAAHVGGMFADTAGTCINRQAGFRAAERCLLPFADDAAREGNKL